MVKQHVYLLAKVSVTLSANLSREPYFHPLLFSCVHLCDGNMTLSFMNILMISLSSSMQLSIEPIEFIFSVYATYVSQL